LAEPNQAKILWKWYREHLDLEYVMDSSQKTEKISPPNGKHDDYCDSSVLGIYATLSMLPVTSTFSSALINTPSNTRGRYTQGPLLTRGSRAPRINKNIPSGL
jgi:hypothetical protein